MFAVYNSSTNSFVLVPGSSAFSSGCTAATNGTASPDQQVLAHQQPSPAVHNPEGLVALNSFLDRAELQGTTTANRSLTPSHQNFQAPSHTRKRSLEQTSDDEPGPGAYKRQSNGGTEAMDPKEKNRLAQRRFRARQRGTISELEHRINDMTSQALRNEHVLRSLREENSQLKLQLSSRAPAVHNGVAPPGNIISPQLDGSTSPAQSLDGSEVSSWAHLPIYEYAQQGGQCQQLDQQAYTTLAQRLGGAGPVFVVAPSMRGTTP